MNATAKAMKIISGGQTGVDRAVLDWAIEHGIEHGGWCPHGRRAGDGVLDLKYRLEETESTGYRQRTRRNVADSDGTLILHLDRLEGGSLLTQTFACRLSKPWLALSLVEPVQGQQQVLLQWLLDHQVRVLNVAGPSESSCFGIYFIARKRIEELFEPLLRSHRFAVAVKSDFRSGRR